MFGSDQMIWPGVIEPAIAAIEDAPFLSARQKRDILYNNAGVMLGDDDNPVTTSKLSVPSKASTESAPSGLWPSPCHEPLR